MSDEKAETNNKKDNVNTSRRDFLKNVGIAGASTLATSNASASISADTPNPDAETTLEEWTQGHFVLMSDDDKKAAIGRLEKRYTAQYKKKTTVSDAPAPEGVLFGYALSHTRLTSLRTAAVATVLRYASGAVGLAITLTLLHPEGMLRKILILYALLPSAVVNVILTQKAGRDAESVASTILVATLVSVALLPLILIFVQ